MKNDFIYKTRVYYADTDCGNVVYNANYLTFMERARDEWFFANGLDLLAWHEEGICFTVYSAQLDFIKPARLFDMLHVNCEIDKVTRASLIVKQAVANAEDPKLIYCRGAIKLVCVNQAMKPRSIPDTLVEKIKNGS